MKNTPSREDILAFIARERDAGRGDKIGKREIARAFGITGSDKIELKRVLRELEDDGRVERRRKSLAVSLARCRPSFLPMSCASTPTAN